MDRPDDHRLPATDLTEEERRPRHVALEGPAGSRSAHSRSILSYLVGETPAGRRDRITGVAIAQDVLGRGTGFDGDADAIVRVQMRRLRMQLAEDRDATPPGATHHIEVPEGAYHPVLRAVENIAEPRDGPAVPALDAPPATCRRRALVASAGVGLTVIVVGLVEAGLLSPGGDAPVPEATA